MSNNSKKLNKSVSFSRYDSIPWPRWSDNDSNSEQWNNSNGSFTHFHDDSQLVELPPSLKPHIWKCPHEIKNFKPIIWSSSNTHPNLFMNNQHLLISEFMRWFISSVTILSYYGRGGLEVTECPGISWNFRDKPWHGSLYIHCMNKSDLGAQHDPRINPHGRYAVRLFFMGCWRRVEINDSIPLNIDGKFLLPRTENDQELWPILLAKALLKIAAISWTSRNEINDFNPIACLTGWSCMSLDITYLSPNDRWELVNKYTEAQNLPSKLETQPDEPRKSEKTSKKLKRRRKINKTDKGGEERIRSKGHSPVVTLLSIHNKEGNTTEILRGIVPNYPVYVESSSDTSSNPTRIQQPLESWKRHRWLPWALRQGIIDPADYFIPTRRIFLFSPTNTTLANAEEELRSSWLDFNTLSEYPMSVYFFFKLDYFKCSIDVADVFPDELQEDKNEKMNNMSRMSVKKKKERAVDDTIYMKKNYEYDHIGMQSRNEPLYLFIDSVHSKFLLLNFSTLPESGRKSSLVIERHCWFNRSLESEALLEIRTMATTSKALCLEPGRHLLRIYCHSKNSYHLSISSDTDFHIGDRKRMHQLMQSESENIKLLATKIQKSMSDLFNSFGTSSYRINLKNYYRSYMPENENNRSDQRLYKSIHYYFRRELIELIIKKCDRSHLEALRILLRDPEIRSNPGMTININPLNHVANSSMKDINREFGEEEQDYHHNLLIVNAVTKIQSFWRMARVNLYKRTHYVNHKRHKSVRKILHHILLNAIDVHSICNLIRNVMKCNDKLLGLYPCNTDMQKVLEVQEFKGILTSISPHQWIPIVHLAINVLNDSIVFACLDLFVDLPTAVLQVFNNDTGCELQRNINNVIPFHYQRKDRGYSIVGYGWTHDKREEQLRWSLHLTTIKGEPQLIFFNNDKPILSFAELLPLQIHELSNIYIPNVNNLILRAILKTPGSCWVAARVHTSYEKVQMKLTVKKNNGQILTEVFGGSTIILPNINLDMDIDEWIFEAIACPKSWSLTAEEWKFVEISKLSKQTSSDESNAEKKASVSVGKKSVSQLTSKYFPETPRWFLQVVSDNGTHLELHEDTSRSDEIEKIKKSRHLNNPDRINRGRQIREKFLQDNYSEDLPHEPEFFINNEIRTLVSPQQRKLSTLNLSKYYVDNDNENRRLKTDSDEEFERIERELVINAFEAANESFIERSSNLLRELQLNVALSSRIPTKRNV